MAIKLKDLIIEQDDWWDKDVPYFRGWRELEKGFPKLPMKDQVKVIFAILQKKIGYGWSSINTVWTLFQSGAIQDKKLIDMIKRTGELHPDRVKQLYSEFNKKWTYK